MVALLRALVVDGKADVRRGLISLLGQCGFESIEACDGIEAIQFASETGIDLIVTDLLMPRMDGFELMGLVRRGVFGEAPPPVIACSSTQDLEATRYQPEYRHFAASFARPLDLARVVAALSKAFPDSDRPAGIVI